jgi:hypothetical protein
MDRPAANAAEPLRRIFTSKVIRRRGGPLFRQLGGALVPDNKLLDPLLTLQFYAYQANMNNFSDIDPTDLGSSVLREQRRAEELAYLYQFALVDDTARWQRTHDLQKASRQRADCFYVAMGR